MSQITFTVSIPTDEGFVGRECNQRGCARYFRVYSDCIKDRMYCPYCGTLTPNDHLHTKVQVRHLERQAEEKAREYMYGEIDKMFGKLSREFRGNSFIKVEHKPTHYRAKHVFPLYREHKVDTELLCPECSFRFQVFGIFGFCPGCGTEHILIYDANLTILRREIEGSDNPRRALRHAYGDLVSTFQTFCSRKAKGLEGDKPSFQELFPARKYFKQSSGVDILEGLGDADLLTIRRRDRRGHI
jgi:hypothetical protein